MSYALVLVKLYADILVARLRAALVLDHHRLIASPVRRQG
jgi:hypothetical protein